jgi:uncharacterized protein (DUF2062 family)
MYYFAYEVGAIALGSATFSFEQFSEFFSIEKAMTLGAPLLVGCLILMHLGALIGYFGVQWLWIRNVRESSTMRRLRSMPFNSAEMCRQSYASFKRYLEHHQIAIGHHKSSNKK